LACRHWPIGVLFDLYGHSAPLPWTVTVHFQSYPEDDLLHCEDKAVVESHVINALKEADCVRNGSAKRTLALLKKDLKQLWEGLRLGRFDQYWAVNKRLITHDDPRAIKHIPFRLYVRGEPVLTEPFAPFADDGRLRTLGELLSEARPDLFPRQAQPRARVMVHGVCPALDTPVLWLSDNCAHPDNFLHLVVHPHPHAGQRLDAAGGPIAEAEAEPEERREH
jgi:autophagy-related protein 5